MKGAGGTQKNTIVLGDKLSFILFWHPFSFPMSATIAATYIFTVPTCTTTITTLEPCADLIKFPHIADLS